MVACAPASMRTGSRAVKLKIAFAIFLTVCYRTPAASGLTQEEIIENIELLVKSMNGLQVELSGFRAEMKEFKTAVEKRMDCLDNRSTACQFNPNVCATARRLEEHIKADNGKAGRNMAVIACVISCFNVAVTVITLIVKGM